MENYRIKTALVRHLNDFFERIPNEEGKRIKVLTREFRKRLEHEIGYSLLSKKNLINQTITSLIDSGSFQQNGRFSCGMELDDEDDLVYPFPTIQQQMNAIPKTMNSISTRVLKNAVTELVRAAVNAKEEVNISIIRETIEKKHSCDLKSRKNFIKKIIKENLPVVKAAPAKI